MIAVGSGTNKGLVVQASGGTGNLMEGQSTAGNAFFFFSSGGLLSLPTGTVSAPSLRFSQDGDTGFNRPAIANTTQIVGNGAAIATFDPTGADITGLMRADTWRIDQTPTAESIVPTHTITISVDGTNYKIPIVAA